MPALKPFVPRPQEQENTETELIVELSAPTMSEDNPLKSSHQQTPSAFLEPPV